LNSPPEDVFDLMVVASEKYEHKAKFTKPIQAQNELILIVTS
jgi:hypothetical protein